VSFFSGDPREVNGKVIPKIYFGTTQVPFEPAPRLLGVTLDSQLSFGPHTLESDLLPLADQANIATTRLHEKALRHRQDTPIAKAARRSEEIARREDPGRRSRNQVQRLSTKSSWRDTAQEIARRAGVDRSPVEPTALGPPPWLDLSRYPLWA